MLSNDGITCHDAKSLANHLREAANKIMPAFNTFTGCDYTAPFFGILSTVYSRTCKSILIPKITIKIEYQIG